MTNPSTETPLSAKKNLHIGAFVPIFAAPKQSQLPRVKQNRLTESLELVKQRLGSYARQMGTDFSLIETRTLLCVRNGCANNKNSRGDLWIYKTSKVFRTEEPWRQGKRLSPFVRFMCSGLTGDVAIFIISLVQLGGEK